MKKIILLLIAMLAIIPLVNAQGKNWRYRGDVRGSIGTEFITSPYTWTVSTSHGAMYNDRLFVGVDFGFKMHELPVIPAYAYVEGRFPFKSNDRNSFILGCGIGVNYWMVYSHLSFVTKVPLGFEFRMKDNRCAFLIMIDLIPLSLAQKSHYEKIDGQLVGITDIIGWNTPDIGANFTLGFRF